MTTDYTYTGSGFYGNNDADERAIFTDVTPLDERREGRIALRARRYGQWWTLRGVDDQASTDELQRERFNNEYAKLSTLQHPCLMRIVGRAASPTTGSEYVVEEWVSGRTLDEFAGLATPDEALAIVRDIVNLLAYCHAKGVCHGNLTTRDILVTDNGHNAKVTGFNVFPNEGEPLAKADIHAIGDIIDALPLPQLRQLSQRCHDGELTTMTAVQRALDGTLRRRRWLVPLVIAALMAAVAFGAFFAGHHSAQPAPADSTALPAIYYSDTVGLDFRSDVTPYFCIANHTTIYNVWHNQPTPGPIPESIAVDMLTHDTLQHVRWAPFNVGCDRIDGRALGGLYLWFDTIGCGPGKRIEPEFTAHFDISHPISGTRLDPVKRYWGGRWRMPTLKEWQSLVRNCQWQLVAERGVAIGYRVTSDNGNVIFLPLAGYRQGYQDDERGLAGHYWCDAPVADSIGWARCVTMTTTEVNVDDRAPLVLSLSIRPVIDYVP